MGAKTGYADAILRCLGLYPGQGAEHYLWCEPDAGVRLLLHALRHREIATKAAAIIASWASEDPRALWERLKAEGPAVCPPVDPREVARVARIISANRLVNPDPETWKNTGNGGYRHGGAEFCTPIDRLADAMAAVPQVDGAAVVDDAREVDPREVARFGFLGHYSHRQGQPESGFSPHLLREYPKTATNNGNKPRTAAVVADRLRALPQVDGAAVVDDARAVDAREVARFLYGSAASYDPSRPWSGFLHPEEGGRYGAARADVARRTAELPTLPATITDDARPVDPPQLPPGVCVFVDPPYLGTTGYAHAFPRSEWLPVVRRWQAAGALVAVSEAEPIADLIAEGWHAVEITGERKGQKRTFSKQQREFLTMSEPPRWRPAVQGTLFG